MVGSSAAATVAARLDGDGRLLLAAAEAVGGDPARSDDALTAALSRVAPPGQVMGIARASSASAAIAVAVPPQAAGTVIGLSLTSRPDWRLLLDLARDAGGPEVVAGTGPDGKVVVLEAQPLYGTADVPVDVETRRNTLKGFVVLFAPESDRLGLPAVASDSDLAIRVVQGQTLLASSGRGATGSPTGLVVRTPINANGVSWTVEVWSTGAASSLPWVVLIAGLGLALVVARLAAGRERSIERVASDAEARAQELALVARTGPMLQQSLALGDLLPVFVVEVSDELGLDNVSISLVSEAGRLVRAFSIGTDAGPLDTDPSELASPQESVGPGELITVPLLRGGRVVGALRARAAGGLTAPQIETLLAVSNLLAAALGNARLFQDEQEMVAAATRCRPHEDDVRQFGEPRAAYDGDRHRGLCWFARCGRVEAR